MDATASPLAPILGLVAVAVLTALIAGAIELGRRIIANPIDVADALDRARWWLAKWDPAYYLRDGDYRRARHLADRDRWTITHNLTFGNWVLVDKDGNPATPRVKAADVNKGLLDVERTTGTPADGIVLRLDTTPLLRTEVEQDYGARFYAGLVDGVYATPADDRATVDRIVAELDRDVPQWGDR